MHSGSILCLGLLSAITVPAIASLVLLVRRRHYQPIKYRGSSLLFVSGLCLYLICVWHLLFLTYQFSLTHSGAEQQEQDGPSGLGKVFCSDLQWILWIANCTMVITYILRTWRVIKIFHDYSTWLSPLSLQQHQLNQSLTHVSGSGDPTVPLTLPQSHSQGSLLSIGIGGAHSRQLRSRIYTERYMLLVLLGLVSLCVALKLVLDLSGAPLVYSGFGCDNSVHWAWLVSNIAVVTFFVLALWQLRRMRDEFGVSQEITAVLCVWVVSTCALAVAYVLRHAKWAGSGEGGISMHTYLELQACVWALRNMALFAVSCMWPIWHSFYNAFPPLWSNCDALCSLDTLLKDIVCIQHFRNYLLSVHRVEWLLCWLEIELYRDLEPEDLPTLEEQAKRIYAKYIRMGAELEVQLSPQVVNQLTQQIHVGAPSVDSFDAAQRELFQLMDGEFPRFLSSPSCEACLHELEKEEVLREVLEKSNMI